MIVWHLCHLFCGPWVFINAVSCGRCRMSFGRRSSGRVLDFERLVLDMFDRGRARVEVSNPRFPACLPEGGISASLSPRIAGQQRDSAAETQWVSKHSPQLSLAASDCVVVADQRCSRRQNSTRLTLLLRVWQGAARCPYDSGSPALSQPCVLHPPFNSR